jgi:hypothetical protein
MVDTTIKIDSKLKDRIASVKGEVSYNDFLAKIFPETDQTSALDELRESLTQKAFDHAEAEGNKLLTDKIAEMDRKLARDEG